MASELEAGVSTLMTWASGQGYSSTIHFYLNGRPVTITNPDPDATLLEYVRSVGLTGTKLGCAEGGCGACTVVVSQQNPTTGRLWHASVNACLAPVVSVDGKHVVTVEGIGTVETPHPVQERIADSNGSQCGFCTPGIVMSMYALVRNSGSAGPSAHEIEEAFDGNLCRCTGYRPILDAAHTFGAEYREAEGAADGCCRKRTRDGGAGCCQRDKDGGLPSGCCKTDPEKAKKTSFVKAGYKPYSADSELIFPPRLMSHVMKPLMFGSADSKVWFRPVTVQQLLEIKHAFPAAKLVAGSSETQIEVKFKASDYRASVYVGDISELRQFTLGGPDSSVVVGGNIALTDLEEVCRAGIEKFGPVRAQPLAAILKQLNFFAGRQIRNVGTPAGNLATASPISDLNPVLLALGATVMVQTLGTANTDISLDHFFVGYRRTAVPAGGVITGIRIPLSAAEGEYVRAYKQAKRKDDDIAIVTACFRVLLSQDGRVEKATLAYGGMAPVTTTAKKTAEFLVGRTWADPATIEGAIDCLDRDFALPYGVPGGMATYRRALALGFFFRFYHDIVAEAAQSAAGEDGRHSDLVDEIEREISSGEKDIDASAAYAQTTVGKARPHVAALKQAVGVAQYTDDTPSSRNELFAALVLSTRPRAKLVKVDPSEAEVQAGVVRWIDHRDIAAPEANFWGIFKDEPFLAIDEVFTAGQPIGVIVADSRSGAEKAARMVRVEYEDCKEPAVLSIEDAIERNSFFNYDHAIRKGDLEGVFASAAHVISGSTRMGGQEHFYLETNACVAIPKLEDGELELISSTQNPTEVQEYAARITGVAANKVVARVKRLGGGFGGKETRSVQLACLCALAAKVTGRPVRAMLDRDVDIATSGQRHPFLGRWRVAVAEDGRLLGLDADVYANAGWSVDLSGAVVDRALSHIDNVYSFAAVDVRGHVARTNTVSNTAFRGFGGPQGMFITESIVAEVADRLGISPDTIREKSMYRDGDVTHFNQQISDWHVPLMYSQLLVECDYEARKASVDQFNRTHRWKKRGIALIPTKFGISFTAVHLNQAGALVHIYHDGSVLVAHGGTEMGQGLHTKMIMIAAEALKIPEESVFISDTATNTVANTSPTAASASSDLNGYAVANACAEINRRLEPYRAQFGPTATMKTLAHAAYMDRVNLSANGFYKTPEIGYDWTTNSGRMSYYFTQGVAAAEVEIDTITGDWTCLRADVKMDVGRSINPAIDYGQIEGAFIQGQGLFTTEQSVWMASSGQIATRGPGTYKIPGFRDIPQVFNLSLLKDVEWVNLRTIQRSRGVGEPPLFLGSCVFFAIRHALVAARAEWGEKAVLALRSPATVERIRISCADPIVVRSRVEPKDGEKEFFVEI